jgi:cytochrome c biogenesis protein CcmG/thiol:disulfide interchange protein DsbE
MRPRRIPAVAIVAVALVGALVVIELATSGGGSEPGGRAAPALPREVLTRPQVTLASLRGHPVLVNFWASWCGPCKREAQHLTTLSHRLPGDAVLVGVDWNDALPGARSFIRHYGWSFPNLRDASGTVGNNFGLSGLPNTFVLDRQGRIKKVLIGPQTVASFERALRTVE